MHKFKVGEKVIVKSRSKRPLRWNNNGKTDHYMGTVQVIESLEELEHGTRVTLYGCKNPLGADWIFRTKDLLPVPEIGDKVKIRRWEDMEDQYGLDSDGDITVNGFSIVKSMKKYCGEIIPVADVSDGGVVGFRAWDFFPYCFEEVYKKVGGSEMEFTKQDLKNGMTVKINGEIFLVNGDSLMCSNGYMRISDYNDDLSCPGDSKWDIRDVCDVNPEVTGGIKNILEQRGKLLWVDEKKEILISEALDILSEKFGCKVKIVEDNQSGGE